MRKLFLSLKRREPNPEPRDLALQDRLIDICAKISGVELRGTWASFHSRSNLARARVS